MATLVPKSSRSSNKHHHLIQPRRLNRITSTSAMTKMTGIKLTNIRSRRHLSLNRHRKCKSKGLRRKSSSSNNRSNNHFNKQQTFYLMMNHQFNNIRPHNNRIMIKFSPMTYLLTTITPTLLLNSNNKPTCLVDLMTLISILLSQILRQCQNRKLLSRKRQGRKIFKNFSMARSKNVKNGRTPSTDFRARLINGLVE